jgi:glutamyl-tRNA reductase
VPSPRPALLHLHQRDASLDARERLSALVSAAPRRRDVVTVLTCHRVEAYAAIPASTDAPAFFADRFGPDAFGLTARVATDTAAVAHLFRVATGLGSVIVGEGQIARQIRRAYDAARGSEVDPMLAALFQRALHLARVLRAGTPLGDVRRSIGSLAVDHALRQVADPARATALVLGAGEIGKLAARALAQRVGRLVIANRDAQRAAELADGIGAQAVGLDRLAAALVDADVVISAADTRGQILTRELLEPRAAARELVLVDIAVPRSVAGDTRSLPGLLYADVDDLATAASNVAEDVVAAAARRCDDEATAFMRWLDERESAATIHAIHGRAEAIRDRQLTRALRRLGHLSDRDREVVASLATSLTHALLHEPTVRLRRAPDTQPAVRALFGLDA